MYVFPDTQFITKVLLSAKYHQYPNVDKYIYFCPHCGPDLISIFKERIHIRAAGLAKSESELLKIGSRTKYQMLLDPEHNTKCFWMFVAQ